MGEKINEPVFSWFSCRMGAFSVRYVSPRKRGEAPRPWTYPHVGGSRDLNEPASFIGRQDVTPRVKAYTRLWRGSLVVWRRYFIYLFLSRQTEEGGHPMLLTCPRVGASLGRNQHNMRLEGRRKEDYNEKHKTKAKRENGNLVFISMLFCILDAFFLGGGRGLSPEGRGGHAPLTCRLRVEGQTKP